MLSPGSLRGLLHGPCPWGGAEHGLGILQEVSAPGFLQSEPMLWSRGGRGSDCSWRLGGFRVGGGILLHWSIIRVSLI